MKKYWFVLLVLLVGCEDKNLLVSQHPLAQMSNSTTPVANMPQTQIQTNSDKLELLNKHLQENSHIYPYNNFQVAIDQSIKAASESIQQDISDIMGTNLQAVDNNYKGQRITFQYQVWQIKKQSICRHITQDAMQFSNCTLAAKQLFQEVCSQLQQDKFNFHPRNQQLKRMYCQAASDFEPTIAQISRSEPFDKNNNKIQELRQKCNDLIFKARISGEAKDEQARNTACKTYKQSIGTD